MRGDQAKSATGKRASHWLGAGAALLALCLATPAVAQERGEPRRAPRVSEDPNLKDTIRVLMIVSMKKALELSKEQEMQVIPRVQEMLEERERFAREQGESLRRLQVKLLGEAAPDGLLREAVGRLDQMEKAHHEREAKLRGEIDHSLSPRQQAELRLFVPRFRRQMGFHIDQARRLEERKRSFPSIPPPGLDLDDDEF